MGRKCCAPNCKVGYQLSSPIAGGGYAGFYKPEGITIHKIPALVFKDDQKDLLAKWTKAIPRAE